MPPNYRVALILGLILFGLPGGAESADHYPLSLRYQQPTAEGSNRYHRLTRPENWRADQLAVIICDMWDSHHSVNAVRRAQELAPRIDALVGRLRQGGATVIHAPSSCMAAYQQHPARRRAQQVAPASDLPSDIDHWCDQIPSEEQAAYPLDQSQGGEDDDLDELQRWAEQLTAQGRNPRSPWLRQIDSIRIDEQRDFISDSGSETWSILDSRQIDNVLVLGVHTNMCVLGRPFGLRRLAAAGKNVALVRDLTDTMYDPRAWPYANHFTGTDIMIDHIERYVCPTLSSDQILGGNEFRFSKDHRPQLTMIIAEDEYRTEESLPRFAARHLSQSFRVTFAFGSEDQRNQILGLDQLQSADALLISVRRRTLPEAELEMIRAFVGSGRPVIGIRTASHAFSLRRDKPEPGQAEWPEFDRQVWGGSYTNHYGNQLKSRLSWNEVELRHPILQAVGGTVEITPGGSLYKSGPLAPGSTWLISGEISGQAAEPVAWTYVRSDGGRSFYTSLGHIDDFAQPQFETLLAAGIHWACGLPLPDLQSVIAHNARYEAGRGRQRP